MPSRTAMRAVAMSGVLLTGCTFIAREVARDPNSLWLITHNVCVPDQRQFGNPSPCMKVDLAAGYVLLKDPNSPTHFVLSPTARVTGIEDPAILFPTAPNYWDQAWRARRYVEERAGRALGRDEVSLAINSINGRTQNQLHIHIDCIKPAVRAALHAHASAIAPYWAQFPVPLAGDNYLAERIDGSDLTRVNPFRLLSTLPQAHADMGNETLVVTGDTSPNGRPGFILLAGHATPGADVSGEALQDHHCTVARLRLS